MLVKRNRIDWNPGGAAFVPPAPVPLFRNKFQLLYSGHQKLEFLSVPFHGNSGSVYQRFHLFYNGHKNSGRWTSSPVLPDNGSPFSGPIIPPGTGGGTDGNGGGIVPSPTASDSNSLMF